MSTPGLIIDFNSGTDGATLATGGGITAVNGTNTYTAAHTIHGALAITGTGTSAAPTFTVARPASFTDANKSWTLSLYVVPVTVPGGAIQLCSLQNSANSVIAIARVHSNGHFDIQVGASAAATTTLSWAANTTYRLDITYNGTGNTVSVAVFAGSNSEGTVANETITATGTTQTGGFDHWVLSPARATTAGAQSYLDTLRFYDGVVTPDPFNPPVGDSTAPTVPTGVTASANSSTSATVAWTASTDNVAVTSYRLRRGGVDLTGATAVTGTSYTDNTLSPLTGYSYTVSAVDAAGNRSAESSAATVTTPGTIGSLVHSWVGAPTSSGFTVAAKFTGATSIRMAVSTSSSMTSPVLATAVTPDTDGYCKSVITGLAANTQYYYQFQDTPSGGTATAIGSVRKAMTLPTVGSQASFNFALSSCITTNATDSSGFDSIVAWNPSFHVFMGDFHYKGLTATDDLTHINGYADQIAGSTNLGSLIANVPMMYCTSDHEAGADNGDSNNAWTQANINAYKRVVPHLPLVDTRTPTAGRYQSWVVGRVRFIMVDIRNTDRTPGATTDSSAKTMLGATQKAWLKSQLLLSEPVKVIISDVAWMGAPDIVAAPDKWWSYATERQEIADYITSHGVKVVFMHGDTHSLATATPAKNTTGAFPVYCGSPLHNTGGGRNLTTFSQYWNNSGGNVRGYGRVTVTDTGTAISFNYVGWDAVAATSRITQTDTFAVAAAKFKTGLVAPSAIYAGTSGVARIYGGTTQVWP